MNVKGEKIMGQLHSAISTYRFIQHTFNEHASHPGISGLGGAVVSRVDEGPASWGFPSGVAQDTNLHLTRT